MLDTLKLKGKIVENGKSVEMLSIELGISPSTFYRKMKNNSFEIGEADRIASILSLSGEDASAIFLSSISHKCDKAKSNPN